jgi:hypothetical protein
MELRETARHQLQAKHRLEATQYRFISDPYYRAVPGGQVAEISYGSLSPGAPPNQILALVPDVPGNQPS